MSERRDSILVETSRLRKTFGDYVAVNQVDMQIQRGQIYGFLGPNGAGKTTTIRMLLGLMRPSSGSIKMFGKDIRTNRIEILSRIGSLVESPSYYRNLTGYENLQATCKLLRANTSEIERVLKIVRLEEAAHRLVRQYSLGMRQRLGIALALLNNPDLLILDEPTNGLDPAGIFEIRELIKQLPQQYGITVLISSHNLAEMELTATHVGIIEQGSLIFQGTIQQLQQKNQPTLHIRVDENINEAISFLQDTHFPAIRADDFIHISGHEQSAAKINDLLVRSGFRVSRLHVQTKSLEDIFLELTGREGSL
ncbi:ABC transporter ATP-binding protein [Paenibacillus assamensis]|uniref:ABC transporter ATP-binding protein n=1 Tax=Paenibacillus assamensis TaxID=311244 RepID=UPI0003F516B8|nr:ABC transporter ATP-binding protein [Paenibacillus assamensis]